MVIPILQALIRHIKMRESAQSTVDVLSRVTQLWESYMRKKGPTTWSLVRHSSTAQWRNEVVHSSKSLTIDRNEEQDNFNAKRRHKQLIELSDIHSTTVSAGDNILPQRKPSITPSTSYGTLGSMNVQQALQVSYEHICILGGMYPTATQI